MAFQPFGYAFEVRSHLAPPAARGAIRQHWKGWLAPIPGSRGWMVGPFICLWLFALHSQGPLLLGVISKDGGGTRISGRAGSDLNGLILTLLLTPVLLFSAVAAVLTGQASTSWGVMVAGIALLSLVGGLWFGHADRREARPLVRFLSDVLAEPGRARRTKRAAVALAPDLTLDVNGSRQAASLTSAIIYDAMLHLDEGGVLILERGPDIYIQAAERDGGFVLEKREGGRRAHFRAARLDAPSHAPGLFTFDEALDGCLAYASNGASPGVIRWEPANAG